MTDHSGKSMFVSSPIDVDLWNSAGWSGVAYLHDPSGQAPPAVGLIFTNEAAGRKIFTDWRSQIGEKDAADYIRVSIIEGDVPGETPGYFVHIGAEPEVVQQRAAAAGMKDPQKLLMTLIGRIHRMTPPANSQNLPNFKKEFAKHGTYQLVPVFVKGGQPQPDFDLAIDKKRVHFRNVADVGPNDIDHVCLVKAS